ncbi:MAG: hypothetical protein AB1734_04080 [Elusimicrobiota bacterium]
MNGIGKDPAFVLTLALGTFAVGGFVAVSHLGRTSEPVQMKSGFSTRFAPERAEAVPAAPASHIENFKRGAEVVKARAYAAASGFGFTFGGPAPAARTATASAAGNESWRYASSSSRGQYADGGPKDWASAYYKGPKGMSAGGSASWAASGSASQTGASASAQWTASGSEAASGEAAAGEEMPGVDAAAVERYARAQASPGAAGQAASAMYASLPSASGRAPGGYSQPSAGGNSLPPIEGARTGTISGMRGGASAADLGGMDEGLRSGSGGSYGAQMAGGAADVAAKVAAVPMPSGDSAKAVTPSGGSSAGGASPGGSSSGAAGGSGSSGGSSGGSSSGAPSANTPKSAGDNSRPEVSPVLYASAQTPDLLQEIASEKLNGREDRYLRAASPELKSAEGTADSGLEALLQPRTVHPSPAPSSAEKSVVPAQTNPDPENLEEVRAARREAIKTETHLFLHKLESRYGRMSDIQRVSCHSDRDTCFDHRLRGSYMTMVTSTGAKLALGFKRTDGGSRGDRSDGRRDFRRSDSGAREPAKWRLYTIDFVDGAGRRPGEAAAVAEEAEEDGGEE